MWLKLNLEGVIFQFRVLNYTLTDKEKWDEQWCRIGIAYQSDSWLNYVREDDETLLSCEIEEILHNINNLLEDKLETPNEITFIEPDFTIIFNPKKDLTRDPRFVYIAPGHEIADIDMELRISFWNDGLTANYLSLRFFKEDISNLRNYLLLVTGEITEEDPIIQKMIKSGMYY